VNSHVTPLFRCIASRRARGCTPRR
jgi:hypothetical protein